MIFAMDFWPMQLIERFNAYVVFVPMEGCTLDVQHSHAIISKMIRPQQACVLKDTYISGQLLSLMKYFDLAVGMCLHILIFAALQEYVFSAIVLHLDIRRET